MSKSGQNCAVVIGASGGIGGALEAALVEEGAFHVVHGFARSRDGAQHIDLLDEASIAAAAGEVAKGPTPTLVIVATGLLHEADKKPQKGAAGPRSQLAGEGLCCERNRAGTGGQALRSHTTC